MNKEDFIQSKIVVWFKNNYQRHNKGIIFAVPNGGTRNVVEAKKLKETGLLAGVSDLIVVLNNIVLFIEVKTDTGKQSTAQLEFENKIKMLSQNYYVVRSLDEFINIIDTYATLT